jgi:hypothetical protein
MNIKLLILLVFCTLIISCKSSFIGKKLNYKTENNSGFEMVFVNDSILEVIQKTEFDNTDKVIYEYNFLEKETLEKLRNNQPSVNFKTKKLYGQFYQNIGIKLINGQNLHFKKTDTLKYVKMRIDGKIKKRIYFDSGNKFIEL